MLELIQLFRNLNMSLKAKTKIDENNFNLNEMEKKLLKNI